MHAARNGVLKSSYVPAEFGLYLSGADAIKLLEFIHRCVNCEDETDFRALFSRLGELFPFDFAHALMGYRDSTDGVVITHRVNISFPEEWCTEFILNYMQVGAVVMEHFDHYRLQKWTETKTKLDEKREITSLCHDFRMTEGYTHGVRSTLPDNKGSMFCFSGPAMECDRRSETILELAIPHLHQALSRLVTAKHPAATKDAISSREKEVLNWLKQGKSSWEISVILGISERTVNFHVYNIMGKLGVANRPQAVAAAARSGLINLC